MTSEYKRFKRNCPSATTLFLDIVNWSGVVTDTVRVPRLIHTVRIKYTSVLTHVSQPFCPDEKIGDYARLASFVHAHILHVTGLTIWYFS
jgi:hypothetical protein